MSAAETNPDLAARLGMIRERIRKRLERTVPAAPALSRPPIERLQKAASAARSLAAAIGTVNPRPPGLAHGLVQSFKRTVARALDWHVRPQRDFNQATAECFAKTAELLEATNQNLQALAASLEPFARADRELAEEIEEARRESELIREQSELVRGQWDEQMKRQRWAYEGMLQRQSRGLAENLRQEFQEELRVLRQRVAAQAKAGEVRASATPVAETGEDKDETAPGTPLLDYFQFERNFRGTEEEIRARQNFYLPYFRGRNNVLDIACGRGEFLELMRELKVPSRGVDLDADMVGRCREKGLDVIQGDVFAHLAGTAAGTLDGIFSAQFVEHLPPETYARLIAECAKKLAPGGVLAIETPNPECLAIFS
ncbi:MAG: class I SAM-dependent methyltransferase, partial [Terriglobia bacterium]